MGRFLKAYGSQVLSILAIASLVGTGIIGQLLEETDTPDGPDQDINIHYLREAFPTLDSFELLQKDSDTRSYLYQAIGEQAELLGYVTISIGEGYLGPMKVIVAWSPEGIIERLFVPYYSDDPKFFKKLYNQGFFDQYIGRSYTDPLIFGEDIDIASGASYSSGGVATAVRIGRQLLSRYLGSI